MDPNVIGIIDDRLDTSSLAASVVDALGPHLPDPGDSGEFLDNLVSLCHIGRPGKNLSVVR
jgi:hypothetical protein